MSYRVLVIPEDPTYNGYILKPLVERMLLECGKPRARVQIATNPRAGGYQAAKSLIPEFLDKYSHYDLFLFLPDADGKERGGELTPLEEEASRNELRLFCCAAKEEVEVWLLAGHVDRLGQEWSAVRGNASVKEEVFLPFLDKFGDPQRAGGGRDLLMQETISNYPGLLARCPELRELQERIQAHLKGR